MYNIIRVWIGRLEKARNWECVCMREMRGRRESVREDERKRKREREMERGERGGGGYGD